MIAPTERQQIIDALRAGAAEIAAVTRDPSFIHGPARLRQQRRTARLLP